MPFGSPHFSGETRIMGWSPDLSEFAQSLMPRWRAVLGSRAQAYQGVGGDSGAVAPPNPYIEPHPSSLIVNQAAIDAGYADDPRAVSYVDPLVAEYGDYGY